MPKSNQPNPEHQLTEGQGSQESQEVITGRAEQPKVEGKTIEDIWKETIESIKGEYEDYIQILGEEEKRIFENEIEGILKQKYFEKARSEAERSKDKFIAASKQEIKEEEKQTILLGFFKDSICLLYTSDAADE